MTITYNQQIRIIKQKVTELARKAKLKVVPEIKISEKEKIAKASFLKKRITIGIKLLSQWKKGEIDEDDIESILAHEIGHLMDFDRKFSSVHFKGIVIFVLYLIFGVTLLKLSSYLPSSEPCVICIYLFLIWFFFLPWIIRKNSLAAQFEADKNASKLIGNLKLANSIIKRFKFYQFKDVSIIETWKLLYRVIFFPSLSERLDNIGFKIKEAKIEIQKRDHEGGKLSF